MMTDPLADMITRIRNCNRIGRRVVSIPNSRLKLNLANSLKREGYLTEVLENKNEGPGSTLTVRINIGPNGEKSFTSIQRVSKPGCRVYKAVGDLKSVRGGLGNTILSTSKGVMSDREARKENIGGECLIEIF